MARRASARIGPTESTRRLGRPAASGGHREGVGDDHFLQGAVGEALGRRRRQHPVGGQGAHAQGPGLAQQIGGGHHRAAGVDHVVDDDRVEAVHVAHHLQGGRLVVDLGLAPLVDEGHAGVEVPGVERGEAHPPGVGGDDHHVLAHRLVQVLQEDGEGGEVVEGLGGEALDLGAVQVHGHDAVGARGDEEVGHEAGGDRLAGQVLLVLAGVAVEGHHRGDPLGRRPLQGVEHDQLLHDVEVDRLAVALQHEAVGAAHALGEADVDLPVGEVGALHPADGDAEQAGHLLRQRRVGRPGEEHHALAAGQFHLRLTPSWGLAGRLLRLASSVAGHLALLAALHRQGPGRHVAGDHRPGSGGGVVADLHRGHQHGVRPDEHPVADDGAVLLPPVVVAGDGAGADVAVLPDDRVADVGEMGHLAPPAHHGGLGLHEGAHLGPGLQAGARAAGWRRGPPGRPRPPRPPAAPSTRPAAPGPMALSTAKTSGPTSAPAATVVRPSRCTPG